MNDDQNNNVIWIYSKFATFGIKEHLRIVEGLQAKINGTTWQICECSKDRDRIKRNEDKYYLTNTKRNHLSFHQTIESAKRMALQGGFKYIRK